MEQLNPRSASNWRIEFARELTPLYSVHENVRMIVLGGSPSTGLSDQYSDLDIIVYWDVMDTEWIERIPLRGIDCERRDLMKMSDTDICLESYFFGSLKVDFGHATIAVWEEMTGEVIEKLNTDGGLQKSIQGFLDSVVLYGDELAAEWKEKLSEYPEGLARKMVTENIRFYVKGCLLNQGWKRDDFLFYYDGLCGMFKKLLGVLAGVNRIYFCRDEPRWLESELQRMPIRPVDTWKRMKQALTSDGETADRILEQLIDEVVSIVTEHMPDIDLSKLSRRTDLRVDGCDSKPEITNTGGTDE